MNRVYVAAQDFQPVDPNAGAASGRWPRPRTGGRSRHAARDGVRTEIGTSLTEPKAESRGLRAQPSALFLWLRAAGEQAQVQHQLPALPFRQKAECRHPGVGIPAADFPEQRAVALRLHGVLREFGRSRCATAILAVARRAALVVKLSPSASKLGPCGERIRF